MNIFNNLKIKIINEFYRLVYYPGIHKLMNEFHIYSIQKTIDSLINSNNSIGRFGDGEILWIFMKNDGSFEKNSKDLSRRLLQVLQSNDKDFEVSLPNIFYSDNGYVNKAKRFYKLFMVKNGYKILPYLDPKKQYYNANISRLYSGFGYNKYISKKLFKKLKRIWSNKNLLIIEGAGTRLGVGNPLFLNARSIRRLECPINNAFESYNKILNVTLRFLKDNVNNKYLILIALGPTATILSYDLFKLGYRAIDIGHIDTEYEWYLRNAKTKINISTKYVNECANGSHFSKIHDYIYNKEIIKKIE